MDYLKELATALNVWDKWSYDFKRHEFIFYTLWIEDEDSEVFKAKQWMQGNVKTLVKLLKKKHHRKNSIFC